VSLYLYERESVNGSKTAVMYVIRFLYVSLGSRTVQVADAHAHAQRLVLVAKMATVLEVCTTEKQRSVVLF
jgi:hypothetical protein